VGDLLELANRALAGDDVGVSASAINGVLSSINEGFEGCDSCGDDDEADAAGFRLLGNDPNPFPVNGSTVIRFAIPEASQVTIDVYDVKGRKVATVADGVVAAGENAVPFDASGHAGLSSGIYLYRLTARGLDSGRSFVKAEKMLLVK
jgi:hypothetical protein